MSQSEFASSSKVRETKHVQIWTGYGFTSESGVSFDGSIENHFMLYFIKDQHDWIIRNGDDWNYPNMIYLGVCKITILLQLFPVLFQLF